MKFIPYVMNKTLDQATIALSMGCDSVAITHFMHTKYPKFDLSCFHFNHMLREQNYEMANKAVEFCHQFHIPLTVRQRDLIHHPDTSEAGLRDARYKALRGVGNVITGHHLDDACENYLFNCFNGVPDYLPIPLITDYRDLKIFRPFLISTKEQMREYIRKNGLERYVVEDETNYDSSTARRNWLRNELIPQINAKGYNIQTIVKKMIQNHIKDRMNDV